MADKKISQLTNATTPLAGTEVLPIVQSGATVKVSIANLTAGRTVDATTVNATTVDATNVEVTNVKAKDGTAALTIADSTGVVSVSANPVLSGGTANGVAYLDASKVVVSGSALTFDGTNFSTTGTATATKLIPTGNVTAGNGMFLPTTDTLAWSTSGSEKARITSTGEWLVNTTSSLSRGGLTGKIQVDGAIRATNGFGASINVGTIVQNATASVTIPMGGLWVITNGTNNSGIMFITLVGGGTGVQGVFATNTSDIVYGGTSEPVGGNYLRIWMSGSGGTLEIKNINAYTGPYFMTPLATFSP